MGSEQDMAGPASTAQKGGAPMDTTLHRKAQAGRAEHQARAMSLAKALRLTLAKVAEEQFEMSMAAISVRSQICPGEKIDKELKETDLLMLFDGPGQSRAAVMVDPAMVGALIQQQTMGKVLPVLEGADRPMTPTDAAIAAPFLDELLKRAGPAPEDPVEQKLISGFRFGAWVEDARVLGMSLDAPDYQLVYIDVDISGGVRQGRIVLCMPQGHETVREPVPEGTSGDEQGHSAPRQLMTLSDTVMLLPVDLRICLAQLRMPLRDLGKLQAGDVLDLGAANFAKVRVQTLAGRAVGRGMLGQLEGLRAVQVEATNASALKLQRRADDRDHMNLPDISTPQPDMEERRGPPDISAPGAMPDLPDLPDMSDLPGLEDEGAMAPMDTLPDLPDLPDMSDLPDFDEALDLPDLPELNVG
jgi:flagellar motor switch/type III secretory pathway protein FliN